MQPLPYKKYVTLNKDYIQTSTECACIYCFHRCKPDDITEYTCDINPDTGLWAYETAICPYCSMDAVIPNSMIDYTDELLYAFHVTGFNKDSAEVEYDNYKNFYGLA